MVLRKYLNTVVERDHWLVKKRMRPMPGFTAFGSAAATLAGIEIAHMIQIGQFTFGLCPFSRAADLAA